MRLFKEQQMIKAMCLFHDKKASLLRGFFDVEHDIAN